MGKALLAMQVQLYGRAQTAGEGSWMQEQLFPFSKNRYFKKKRMRSVDFERDQAFADHKLAFLSHWVFGSGIAMGLGAARIDSDSLLVEPGVAIDPQGRYLIVDEPAVCRVKTLEGFSELEAENALLWISYQEELLDPMFVADDEGQSMHYAVAKERYAFSLTADRPLPPSAAEQLLFSTCVLFEDEDVRVTQTIPQLLSRSEITLLQLSITCFCPEPMDIEVTYAPRVPGFAEANSGGPVSVTRQLRLSKGETVLSLPIRTEQAAQAVWFSLDEADFTIEKRGICQNAQRSFRQEFQVVSGSPLAALEEQLLSHTPQELWDGDQAGVPIAVVRFVRYDDKALLDDVVPISPRLRAPVPYLRESLRRAGLFYQPLPAAPEPCIPVGAGMAPADAGQDAPARQMSTGTVHLNTGMNQKAGSVLTSEEIAHELGPGTVYVEFGIEQIYPVANLDQNRTDLLLGDVSLFEQASGTYEKNMDRGVRIHPDKGTFELAVRLGCDLRQSILRLRWFAWRPEHAAGQPAAAGTLLRLSPDVIHAKPGDVLSFTPVFSGEPVPCDFFSVDRHGGVMTRDGIYTVPDREGLYQVCAQVRGRPEERANAFIIVEAQGTHDERGGV